MFNLELRYNRENNKKEKFYVTKIFKKTKAV
jgi:hypothetical protein